MVYVASVIGFVVAMLLMAVGLLLGGRSVSGTCGGVRGADGGCACRTPPSADNAKATR